MLLEPHATIAAAVLGFLAALLPKLYEYVTSQKKQRFDYATALAEQLTIEGQELRKELRKEIEVLRTEIATLREENEVLKEDNLKLKIRISQLDLEIDKMRIEEDSNE